MQRPTDSINVLKDIAADNTLPLYKDAVALLAYIAHLEAIAVSNSDLISTLAAEVGAALDFIR